MMRSLLVLFAPLLACQIAFCQEPVVPSVQADTAASAAVVTADSLSTEQLLLQMKQQMTDLQLKIDQIQNAVASPKQPVEIIPTKEKNNSHFYCGLQFAGFLTSAQYAVSSESKQPLGTRFSFAIKPSVGYVFTPRWNAGIKLVYADCQFSGLTSSTLPYIIANAFIGGGAALCDYVTWNVQPYVRYKISRLFWDRVNFWAELSGYAGQQIPRDAKTRELQTWNTSTVYGVALRPMITCDLNRNLMIFTCFDFISWNGSKRVSNDVAEYNNGLTFQFVPIYSLLSGLFNIGLLRKF